MRGALEKLILPKSEKIAQQIEAHSSRSANKQFYQVNKVQNNTVY